MQSITNFSIFRNQNKKQDNHPDYTISAKVQKNNVDEFKEIGAVYLKEIQNGERKGEKFFSCQLSKPREFNGKQFAGYVIVDAERYAKMEKVYEDHLISLREPEYPTPTKVGIDIDKVLVPDITPADLDNWERDFM